MNYPEVGDKLWLVHDGYPIVIKVTVMDIGSEGIIVDEPTEYEIGPENLYSSIEEASDALLACLDELKKIWSEEFPGQQGLEFEEHYTLKDYRKDISQVLQWQYEDGILDASTLVQDGVYPNKEDSEWRTVRQLKESRGTPRSEFEALYRDV